MTTDKTAGVIFCGGRSRRMGADKATLVIAGEPLLARIVRVVAGAVEHVLVAAAPDQKLPALPSRVTVVRDRHPNRGPLTAFADALESVPPECELVFATGCDTPFLTPAVIRNLMQMCERHEAAAPHIDGRWHPLTAVYRHECAATAKRLIAAGKRRMHDLIEALDVRGIGSGEWAAVDPSFHALLNLNSPEDYAEALRLIGARDTLMPP